MKIVSWNCNGAFRKKFEIISMLGADIYIIQECEDPVRANSEKYAEWATNYLWIGDTKNKEKPYHIDYFFSSEHFLLPKKIEIENSEKWIEISDHLPLIYEQ